MTSIQSALRCCAACKSDWLPAERRLRRCARCHAISYCSRKCQKAHWPDHKVTCRTASPDGEHAKLRQYATIGCNSERPEEPEPDTIFYLKTSRPYVCDISISGPFYPLGMIVPQILNNIKDSAVGFTTFSDCFLGTEGHGGLGRFESIEAPLDDDPEKFLKIELVRKHNPTLARILPGPTYTVYAKTMSYPSDPEILRYARARDYVPLQDVEIHDAYPATEEAEAECAAMRLLETKLQLFPGGIKVIMGWRNGPEGRLFVAAVSVRDPGGVPIPKLMVVVRLESGFVLKTGSGSV